MALKYSEEKSQEVLSEVYKALLKLSEGLYFKYVRNYRQTDFEEDIRHDACVICVENLKKGKVSVSSGWSRYLIQIMRNRSNPTNPLHLAYSRAKRGKASRNIKEGRGYAQTAPVDIYNIDEALLHDSNIRYLDTSDEEIEGDDLLRKVIQVFVEDISVILPFNCKSVQSLFLYFMLSSVFEISTSNSVFFARSGFPKRYRFLGTIIRNRFKGMVDKYVSRSYE